MFEEITRRKDRRPAARKGTFVAFSAAVQAAILLALLALAAHLRPPLQRDESLVPIQIVRSAPPVSAPAPPPPPPPRRTSLPVQARRPPVPRPPTEVAMVQPKSVSEQLRAPPPEEPVETPPTEAKEENGTTSGVPGGEPGGVVGGIVGGQREGAGASLEEVPAYATAGYRKPELAQSGCLQSALNIPRELQRSLAGQVTVKFAIRKDGTPTSFQVLNQPEDNRIADVIWKAVTSCRWVPGADPKGRPASIWVVVPFRFQTG